jgi:peptide/nickel transport system permease protein
VLFATANLILFFASIFWPYPVAALRQFADRAVIALAPTSAAPGWFYGIFLILIFAAVLGAALRRHGGAPPPETRCSTPSAWPRHLILPATAILISAHLPEIYNWRTFFLIYSSEDYVEMAKAKGLPPPDRAPLHPAPDAADHHHQLCPDPDRLWTGAIILETVFNWPGWAGASTGPSASTTRR